MLNYFGAQINALIRTILALANLTYDSFVPDKVAKQPDVRS
jgi:hypothetical protein